MIHQSRRIIFWEEHMSCYLYYICYNRGKSSAFAFQSRDYTGGRPNLSEDALLFDKPCLGHDTNDGNYISQKACEGARARLFREANKLLCRVRRGLRPDYEDVKRLLSMYRKLLNCITFRYWKLKN